MKISTRLSLLAVLLASGVSAHAACVYPQAPTKFPNGATATKDEMLAAQKSVKEYQAAVEGTYLPCLEQEKNAAVAALDPADPDLANKKQSIEAVWAKKNNAAVDELQAVAAHFNDEIKAYSAAQKK
ncbi:MAG: hypothetical protein FIB04_06750 [Gammaproteobacteria bacterium]|nr:hypothetical protein [Gammaproteobacteria bacterium]